VKGDTRWNFAPAGYQISGLTVRWGGSNPRLGVLTRIEAFASPIPPAAPTGLGASATSSSVTLHWNQAARATRYQVWRSFDRLSWDRKWEGPNLQFVDSGLPSATRIYYRVHSVNCAADIQSDVLEATTGRPTCRFTRIDSWCTSTVLSGVDVSGTLRFTLLGAPRGAALIWALGTPQRFALRLPLSQCLFLVSPMILLPVVSKGPLGDQLDVPGPKNATELMAQGIVVLSASELTGSNGVLINCSK